MQRTGLLAGDELDDSFTGLQHDGVITIAGFGSLLSERSARSTFPHLNHFRPGRIQNWRRVFAHTCEIFHKRGIANIATGEMSSLSCEPCAGGEVVVSLFEIEATPSAIAAFIEREHEFAFVAVQPTTLDGQPEEHLAVICAVSNDEAYRARRCPPHQFEQRYGQYGISRVWYSGRQTQAHNSSSNTGISAKTKDAGSAVPGSVSGSSVNSDINNDSSRSSGTSVVADGSSILPCRVYLRHCVLAAQGFCPEAHENFLDNTFLADRVTTVRQYLQLQPGIMQEQPPEELIGRYSG